MMAIRRQHVILFPGVLAVLANGVPFATYPEPFLSTVYGMFILTASVFSIGLGAVPLRKRNEVGKAAMILGLAALFTVRESGHRAAEAPALGTAMTLFPKKRSQA